MLLTHCALSLNHAVEKNLSCSYNFIWFRGLSCFIFVGILIVIINNSMLLSPFCCCCCYYLCLFLAATKYFYLMSSCWRDDAAQVVLVRLVKKKWEKRSQNIAQNMANLCYQRQL